MSKVTSRAILSGMMRLFIGASASRLIGIASMPLITRIYTPEDVGYFSVFTSSVILTVPFLMLRYSTAIPLSKSTSTAVNVAALSLAIATAAIVILSVSALLFTHLAPDLIPSAYGSILPLVVLGSAVAAITEIVIMWHTRTRSYSSISKYQITQSGIGESLKLGLGVMGMGNLGLMIGQISGHILAAIIAGRIRRREIQYVIKRSTIKRAQMVALRYRNFPLYNLPAQVLLNFSLQSPIIYSALAFGTSTAGQFGLAFLAVSLPFNLIGQSTSRAYYSEIAALGARSRHSVSTVTLEICKAMALWTTPIAILVYFAAEPIFMIAFGQDWVVAGRIAAILAITIPTQFIAGAVIEVLAVYERQRYYLLLLIQRATLVGILYSVTIKLELTWEEFTLWLATATILHHLAIMFVIYNLLKEK